MKRLGLSAVQQVGRNRADQGLFEATDLPSKGDRRSAGQLLNLAEVSQYFTQLRATAKYETRLTSAEVFAIQSKTPPARALTGCLDSNQIFQEPRSHFKVLDTRGLTNIRSHRSKFSRLRFVHPCPRNTSNQSFLRNGLSH